MIKAIIFDCFGVIITDALEGILTKVRQEDPEVAKAIIAEVNNSNKGLITRNQMAERIGSLLNISGDEYLNLLKDGEVKNTELFNFISELRSEYKTALLSNVGKAGISSRFTEAELKRYFDAVVVSGEIGFAKPEPQAYEIAADKLNVRLDECVFIDDREEYCQGAVAVGMRSILYRDNEQLKLELNQMIKLSVS